MKSEITIKTFLSKSKLTLLLFTLLWVVSTTIPALAFTAGQEWELILAQQSESGLSEKDRTEYLTSLKSELKKNQGVLNERRYTEYSKTVLALTIIGEDPAKTGGYNLLEKLEKDDMVIRQGLNGPIWALIALDSLPYQSEKREVYKQYILDHQLPGSGWNMEGKGTADPDVTAMALQALSTYRSEAVVKKAIDAGVAVLASLQEADGGYESWGTANSESVSQVIIALCALGIPVEDKRFVKNGHTVIDNLNSFRLADGTYMHAKSIGKADGLATEQARTALAAYARSKAGKSFLYRFQ